MRYNFEYKKIGDICKIKTGKLDANASSVGGLYPFFTCSKENLYINTFSYDEECVLISGNGDLNVKYYKGKFDAYQRTYIITLKNKELKISVLYLFRFFSKYVEYLRKISVGGVIKYIKLNNLTDAIVPIPPIEEQERIVAELDLISGVIEKQKTQLKELDNLAQSIFYDMFGDPVTNEKGWNLEKMSNVCSTITDGDHNPPPKSEQGIPFITISNIDKINYGINFQDTYYVPVEYYNNIKEEKKPLIGDVLYTVTGSYGIPIIVNKSNPFCFKRHIGLLRPTNIILPVFLASWLKSEGGKSQADMSATGIAQKTVSLSSIKNFIVPTPPLPLQQEFAQKIQAIEQQKASIKKSIEETQKLFDYTMDKYFSN